MPELLIELFCEEIPARMQKQAAADLARLMQEACANEGLTLTNVVADHGPRRITLVSDAPAATASVVKEERGPSLTAPEAALRGFVGKSLPRDLSGGGDVLMAAALEKLRVGEAFEVGRVGPRLEARASGKATHIYLLQNFPGRNSEAVIATWLTSVLRKLAWPKSMRWGGSGEFTFARPLRRVLCLFDGAVVPIQGLPAGLAAGAVTEGHRFLAPAPIKVSSHADYVRRLREACVIVDAEERKRLISEGAATVAADAGLRLVEDAGLLEEVAGLVEWPVPMLGRIDAEFMDLPPEVLRTSMRVNQRYFATTYADDKPAPHFVVIANVPGSDGGAAIVAGNERVLRARFSDARFFWDQDRKQPLAAFLPKLETVTFHAKLGTQAERVARIAALAERIAPLVGADAGQAKRAAELCKADLATGMVGEFPELQGLMGSYYARGAEGDAVADAIRDHYAPRGPNDPVPTAPVSVAVAMADKLDQLAGFFAVGEKPTGSGDPFGLRRAGLGMIRLIRENGLRLDLLPLLSHAAGLVDAFVLGGPRERTVFVGGVRINVPAPEIRDFLADRLRVQFRTEGKRHDIVTAVLARATTSHPHPVPLPEGEGTVRGGSRQGGSPLPQGEGQGEGDENPPPATAPGFDLVLLLARVDALASMLDTDDGKNLLAAYKRAANILRIEEKKDSRPYTGPADPNRMTDAAEIALHAALTQAAPIIASALDSEDFSKAMAAMASLRQPLDTFFADVTVNAPETDLRENRLKLLAELRSLFDRIADFSKIEG